MTGLKSNAKKKYELTSETKVMPSGETVYRIRALRSFDTTHKPVQAGDLGGWVASEANLSHEGNCWLFDEATGYQNSKRTGDSVGYDRSQQSDNSRQFGNSQQYGNSRQYGYSRQSGHSQQSGNSQQYGNSWQCANSCQYGDNQQHQRNNTSAATPTQQHRRIKDG